MNKIADGWTGAVYLTLIKYARDRSIDDIRRITRLIRTAVFDGFDADTQRILLQLSLLDGFTTVVSHWRRAPGFLRLDVVVNGRIGDLTVSGDNVTLSGGGRVGTLVLQNGVTAISVAIDGASIIAIWSSAYTLKSIFWRSSVRER